MDILKNPFAILGATLNDNRQRIIELADERSLVIDADMCAEARSILTHPRKRLSAEVAWLPGADEEDASQMLSVLKHGSESSSTSNFLLYTESEQVIDDYSDLWGITPIAWANFSTARFSRMPPCLPGIPGDMPQRILKIAQFFEDVDAETLMDAINRDRGVAGFSEVTDISAVEAEIQERKRYYTEVIRFTLDNLLSEDLVAVLSEIVEKCEDDMCPYIISDLVDIYEASAQSFFDKETENAKSLIQTIKEGLNAKRSDSGLKEKIDQLVQVIRNWGKIAKPLILRANSMGIDYNRVKTLLEPARSLSLFMNNKYRKSEFALALTLALKDSFSDMDKIVEMLDTDVYALEGLLKQKEKIAYEANIGLYEANIGLWFKEKIFISAEGINWRGRLWKLEDITRVRWGGVRHRQGFFTDAVVWGTAADTVSLNVREAVYGELVHCLWNAIGVRLFIEYLEGLQSGKSYYFASSLVSDFGMEIERRKFFSTERIFCSWENMVLFNGNGTFCVGSKNDKSLSSSFSYLQDDNIHVLEAMLQGLWNQRGYRHKLSSLLTSKGG
jgi:hypothetical protein